METIKQALMRWGEAMQVIMENRAMFYSPVLKHWRVRKWAGKDAKSFLYDGEDLDGVCTFAWHARHGTLDWRDECV